MLEFAKAVHSAIGTESPRMFIAVFAIAGLLIFGVVGWIVDQGYQNERKTLANRKPAEIGGSEPSHSNPPRDAAKPREKLPKKHSLAPIKSAANLIPFSVRHLDSGDAKFPDEMRITLQPKASIQPIHVILKCKEEFGRVDYSFTFPSGMNGVLDGINPRPKEYEFMIGSPALTPENPLISRVLSATRNDVIQIERH